MLDSFCQNSLAGGAIAAFLRTNAKSTLGDSEVYAVVVPGSDQERIAVSANI